MKRPGKLGRFFHRAPITTGMSENNRAASASIVGRQVVETENLNGNRAKGTITRRHVEEAAPPKPQLTEANVRSLLSEMFEARLEELDKAHKTKLSEMEKFYLNKIKTLEESLLKAIEAKTATLEERLPVVNVTVENRTRVTKKVIRDDRGLITDIIEETQNVQ